MVDRKIEKIARMQSRGEDGKAGVSAWRTGKSRQIEATVSNQRGGGNSVYSPPCLVLLLLLCCCTQCYGLCSGGVVVE